MDFKEYRDAYTKASQTIGIPAEKLQELLKYAETLYNNSIPIIYDQRHFSKLVGYDYKYILSITNQSSSFYKEYSIPKRNGGKRVIHEPYPSLKEIQSWILKNILINSCSKFVSPVAKAYMRQQSVRDNARFHKGQKILLCLDLQDFFGSIPYIQVYNAFKQMGYNNSVATMLGNLCTLNDSLPQGAPTSPMLSNIVFKYYDDKIFEYCKNLNIRYTRYADDLTFSGDFNPGKVISYIKRLLSKSCFKLNEDKTKITSQSRRQEVTGIVVNKIIQTSRTYRNQIRQEVYYIVKYGLEGHLSKILWKQSPIDYLHHLLGKINFTLMVNKQDSEMQKYYNYIKSILIDYKNK